MYIYYMDDVASIFAARFRERHETLKSKEPAVFSFKLPFKLITQFVRHLLSFRPITSYHRLKLRTEIQFKISWSYHGFIGDW